MDYFGKDTVFSINEMEWWLLKNAELYRDTHCFIYDQDLFTMGDGTIIRLPVSMNSTYEENFLTLYENLDTISQYHRKEMYFEQEVIHYHRSKQSRSQLKKWVIKNEFVGTEEYICFLIDYLDHPKETEYLEITIPSIDKLKICINRQDFKHTIRFLEIFNELYWNQEILSKQ